MFRTALTIAALSLAAPALAAPPADLETPADTIHPNIHDKVGNGTAPMPTPTASMPMVATSTESGTFRAREATIPTPMV